jgi:hypothetical protein
MIDSSRFRGSPCEDPKDSVVHVPEDDWDFSNSETKRVVYDRTLLFPLTRWIQMHRGETITHKKLKEFKKLCMEVHKNWSTYTSNNDNEYKDELSEGYHQMVDSVRWAMLHIWDVRGELRPWLAEDMCKVLIGTKDPEVLPRNDTNAYKREREFRGGISSMEMVMGNIDSSILGGEKPFEQEDIEEARETNQGQINYEHDLESYLNPQF